MSTIGTVLVAVAALAMSVLLSHAQDKKNAARPEPGFRDRDGDPLQVLPARTARAIGWATDHDLRVTTLGWKAESTRHYQFELIPANGPVDFMMLFQDGDRGWLWRVAGDDDVLGMAFVGPGAPLGAVPTGKFPPKCEANELPICLRLFGEPISMLAGRKNMPITTALSALNLF
jgi:hypothetical protein